jgi:hypothetical protein
MSRSAKKHSWRSSAPATRPKEWAEHKSVWPERLAAEQSCRGVLSWTAPGSRPFAVCCGISVPTVARRWIHFFSTLWRASLQKTRRCPVSREPPFVALRLRFTSILIGGWHLLAPFGKRCPSVADRPTVGDSSTNPLCPSLDTAAMPLKIPPLPRTHKLPGWTRKSR